MNSLSAMFALLSLLVFTTVVESRVGLRNYEKSVIEKQLMPENLWNLVRQKFELSLSNGKGEKADCNENEKPIVKFEKGMFEPRPNLWLYDDGNKIPESRIDKFEPRPNYWLYDDGNKIPESRIGKFQPRPNLWVYDDNKIPESRISKFEPKPNFWLYDYDTKLPKSRTLEDKPVSKVAGEMIPKDNNPKDKLSFEGRAKKQAFEEDFEPRPSVTVYND